MVTDRIRKLREQYGYSQSELAKKLDVTRSSVNAWESGLSTPTTQYIVSMANLFHVSCDYLLGQEDCFQISLNGYSKEQIDLITSMLKYFDNHHN